MGLMKQRSTTPVSKGLVAKFTLVATAVLMLFSVPVAFSRLAIADKFDDQINAIQREIDSYQAQAAALSQQAKTLETELASLAAQKATIQGQIDLSQARYDKLIHEIAITEQQIIDNKDALGQIIADIYVDGSITPLEMLASAENIGDYVDQQEYRSSIQSTLSDTIDRVNTLKLKLEDQKKEVEQVLADQKMQRDNLAAKEAEQAKLLADTRGQESAFQSLSVERQTQIKALQQQQQAEIQARLQQTGAVGSAVAGDPNKGGYPDIYANTDYYNPIVDEWGMYTRQCVSYTAWKVEQKNGYMPYWGGVGNANQWPGNAVRAGIQTSSVPRAKSVGVISSGYYGHVVWVESVNGDGTVNISQYNEYLPGAGWGYYSERYNVPAWTYDTYIYF
ncbi:CHAP domain-containing protein [Candidatus Saccharibacteria bacterium]|nr:CHAP domain-containing protein [Candidatus Saccharibacteria bacterium]